MLLNNGDRFPPCGVPWAVAAPASWPVAHSPLFYVVLEILAYYRFNFKLTEKEFYMKRILKRLREANFNLKCENRRA
jgi:hypothetical protein